MTDMLGILLSGHAPVTHKEKVWEMLNEPDGLLDAQDPMKGNANERFS